MGPRLAAIDGPLNGQVLLLEGAELSVGRDPGSGVRLDDCAASRRHCVIRVEAESGAATISDCGSHNGTFVNGRPVIEQALRHGDQIRVGRSCFVFMAADEELPGPTSGELFRRFEETSTLRMADAERGFIALRQAAEPKHPFDEIAAGILDVALHAIPAERAAILMMEKFGSTPDWVQARDRAGREIDNAEFPRAAIERVLERNAAVLGRIPGDTEADPAVTVIAAPLAGTGGTIGVLCLESRGSTALFTSEHLQVIAKTARVAGPALEAARYAEWLKHENERLISDAAGSSELIGLSRRMKHVNRFIARVAPSDCTVLIQGETGTGKELVARAIHRASPRATHPFVAINSAALSETLLESELFGHERGAFTGAVAQKPGKLEVAQHGTVFLDEVSELPASLQAKLLRAIQEREFERVGGTRTIKVDIRLIAATNVDLKNAVAEGRFREDLYFRLNVVSVNLPPLRNRREDIPLLAQFFASRAATGARRRITGVSPEAMACLLGYDWPGNVRELENAIERAAVLGSTELILAEDLPETILEGSNAVTGEPDGFHQSVRRHKKEIILRAVERAGGNCTEAAKILGLHPNYLHRLITALRLRGSVKQKGAGTG